MNDAVIFCGASPTRAFFAVMLPLTWSCILGSLLVAFVMSLNSLDMSFYLFGATQTMPSVAGGALRYGEIPELYTLWSIMNIAVCLAIRGLFLSIWSKKAGQA